MLVMVFSLSTMYAFTGEEAVNKSALEAFKNDYSCATDAVWTVGSNYYKVSFTLDEKKLFAFYNTEGEFMGVSRNIFSSELPGYLQKRLKKSYSNFWISELFEVATPETTGYYITMENADSKVILRSLDGSNWSVFKKSTKA